MTLNLESTSLIRIIRSSPSVVNGRTLLISSNCGFSLPDSFLCYAACQVLLPIILLKFPPSTVENTATNEPQPSSPVVTSETAVQEMLTPASTLGFNALTSCTISPASSPAQPHTMSFTLFPKLPPEIRKMIWTFASCHPQVIKRHDLWPSDSRLPFRWVGNSVPLLSACRESCRAALEVHHFQKATSTSKPFYVSSQNTIVLLASISLASLHATIVGDSAWRKFVTVLAVDPFYQCDSDISLHNSKSTALVKLAEDFRNLREIILVNRPGHEARTLRLATEMREYFQLSEQVSALFPEIYPIPRIHRPIPKITCLGYKRNKGEGSLSAMSRSLVTRRA